MMKQSQLRKCAQEASKMNFDPKQYASVLCIHECLTLDEKDLICSAEITSHRIQIFFLEILPGKKNDSIIRMLPFLSEEMADVLRLHLGLPKDFGDESGTVEKVEKLDFLQLLFLCFNFLRGLWLSCTNTKRVKTLQETLKKLFQKSFFAEIQPIPSHPLRFNVDKIWVDLKMEIPGEPGKWKTIKMDKFWEELKTHLETGPVLIRGEPGIGKSTVWKRICHEWSLGNKLTSYDLILPCRLRDVSNVKSILDLSLLWLLEFLPSENRGCIEKLLIQGTDWIQDKRILVILDGWDEYEGRCDELEALLNRPKRLNFSLIITSRPTTTPFKECSSWSLIKIDGFTLENMKIFVSKFFKVPLQDLRKDWRTSRIMNAIRNKKYIKEMARVPLMLSYMCIAPDTLKVNSVTELYLRFCEFLHKRFWEGQLEIEEFDIFNDKLWSLGKLAFKGLLSPSGEQLVFNKEQLMDIDKTMFKIGYIADEITQFFRESTRHAANFSHKTMQEFFAAVALVQALKKGEEEKAQILLIMKQESITDGLLQKRLKQVYIFVLGLISSSADDLPILQEFLRSWPLPSSEICSYYKACVSQQSKILFCSSLTSCKTIRLQGSIGEAATFLLHTVTKDPFAFHWCMTSIGFSEKTLDNILSPPRDHQQLKLKLFSLKIKKSYLLRKANLEECFTRLERRVKAESCEIQSQTLSQMRHSSLAAICNAIQPKKVILKNIFLTDPTDSGIRVEELQIHNISLSSPKLVNLLECFKNTDKIEINLQKIPRQCDIEYLEHIVGENKLKKVMVKCGQDFIVSMKSLFQGWAVCGKFALL